MKRTLLRRERLSELIYLGFMFPQLLAERVDIAFDYYSLTIHLITFDDDENQRRDRGKRNNAGDCPRQRVITKWVAGEIKSGAHGSNISGSVSKKRLRCLFAFTLCFSLQSIHASA